MLTLPVPTDLPISEGWRATASRAPVRFPFDGTTVAHASVGSVADADDALAAAHAARRDVAAWPVHARRAALRAAHARLDAGRDELADVLVAETGKPLVDCRTEVARALVALEVSADEAGRVAGETVPLDLQPGGEGMVGWWTRRPVGVVVGITGFNYPLLLALHKVAPALAAGCPVIVKPAEPTPLATLWLAAVLREAGVPPAAVQVVTGGADVGDALVTDPRTRAVSFTGSARVGHAIAHAAGPKPVTLELGSNAPLLVAADADVPAAASAVARGGFYASGQACISVQRVLVERPVAAEFADRVAAAVDALAVGDPREESTRVAPLIDAAAAERVRGWITAAERAGARQLTGDRADLPAGAVAPTVLADVPADAEVWREEVFGPVVCLRTVDSFDAGLAAMDDSAYGLHASVYTSDLARAFAAAERLEVGGLVVNEVPGFRVDNMPYGGVKASGLGREGPRFAIEAFTVPRMVMVRPAPRR